MSSAGSGRQDRQSQPELRERRDRGTTSRGRGRTSARARWSLVALLAGYALLDLAAGAPGSPLVPTLPRGVRALAWEVRGARAVGLTRFTRTQLALVCVGLMVVTVAAFVVVLSEAWHGRVRIGVVAGAVLVALAGAVAAPVLLSRDVYSYAAYGRILAVHGSNPYQWPPAAFPGDPFVSVASPEWVGTRSVYGPVFTLASAAIARAWSGSPGATILGFKILAGASVGLAALFAARAARVVRPDREVAAAVAVGLNPVLVVHTVGGGHNDAMVAALLVGAFAVSRSDRERPRAAGRSLAVTFILTLAVLVKAVLAPVLVLWLWTDLRRSPRRRPAILAGHVAVVVATSAAAFVPVAAGWDTARALLSVATRQGWTSGPGLLARGARGLGHLIGGSAIGAVLEGMVSGAFALLFLVVFARILARSERLPAALAWGSTLLLLALAAPYLLPWYAAWFVPFLPFMDDAVPTIAGVIAAALLALTGIPAEPGTTPALWQGMLLAVHYAAAPVMLALLVVVVRRLWDVTEARV